MGFIADTICSARIDSGSKPWGASCCLGYKLLRAVARQRVIKNRDR